MLICRCLLCITWPLCRFCRLTRATLASTIAQLLTLLGPLHPAPNLSSQVSRNSRYRPLHYSTASLPWATKWRLLVSIPNLGAGKLMSSCCSLFFPEHEVPPFFDLKPVSVELALGESGSFKCHVTGTAPIKITWAKDNREIRPGGNYKMTLVENTATLTVLKVAKGDAGQYTCYASNVAGKDSCSAQLGVQGTP